MTDNDKKAEAVKAVIGKTLSEAMDIIGKEYPEFTMRVVWIDGKSITVTKDRRMNRLNVGIQDEIILGEFGHHECDGVEYCLIPRWY
jgi:hypothetical protein